MKIQCMFLLILIITNCAIFTAQNKKINFYSTIEDKKWDIKRLFFIGKKDKESTLYNIPKNMINHIFKYVLSESRCYVESFRSFNMPVNLVSPIEDIFFTQHFYYRMRFPFYRLKDLSFNYKKMYCYEVCSDILMDDSVLKNIPSVLKKTINQAKIYVASAHKIFVYDMPPEQFQKYLDTTK